MKVPEVVLFGDDYYQRVIYSLAAYIADYEEQVLLSCIVCNWCPNVLHIGQTLTKKHSAVTESTPIQ